MSQEKSRQSRILSGFLKLSSTTMISRVTGLIREMALAFFLGSGSVMDAYVIAYTLPNLFRRIFGEKLLETAMLPTYKLLDRAGDKEAAGNLAKTTLFLLISIGSFVTALGMAVAPWLVQLFAPGFDPETHVLAVTMTRIMFPFLVIISVISMFGVILQTREKFGIYGIAPAMFNVGTVVIMWIGMSRYGPLTAAVGVLIGGLLEALVMWPTVRQTFRFNHHKIALSDPNVKKVNKLAGPVLVETILDKTIVLVDRRLASIVSTGSIAALGYSFRLLQLPHGILVLGIARTFFQHMVDAVEDLYEFVRLISGALRFTLAIMTPATLALFVFSELIIRIVYQRGAFDETAVLLSSSAFAYYSLGLVGMTALSILSRAFNSMKDTLTPVIVSIAMMFINIVLNYALVKTPLQHAGLALATSIAYSFAGVALLLLIRIKIRTQTGDGAIHFSLLAPFIKILISSLAASAASFYLIDLSAPFIKKLISSVAVSLLQIRFVGGNSIFFESLLGLCLGSAVFLIVYISFLRLLKQPITKLLKID